MKKQNYNIANDLSLLCAIYPNDADLGFKIRTHYGKRKKKETKEDQKKDDKKNIYQTNDRHT